MAYELIFQFPEEFFQSLDEVHFFEDGLIASLPKSCDIAGHDIGSGTVNFFVYTEFPLSAFKTFRKHLGTQKIEKSLRVSFP